MKAPPWVQPFLHALAASGIVSRACTAAGVGYSSVSHLRKTDADFAAAYDDAMEQAVDRLEAEAWRRAHDGVEEPIVYQGQLTPVWERDAEGEVVMATVKRPGLDGAMVDERVPVQARNADGSLRYLTVRKHSDPLLMFLLKGLRKKFGTDRTELTGADGGAVQVSDTERATRLAQILAAAKARKQAAEDFGDLA